MNAGSAGGNVSSGAKNSGERRGMVAGDDGSGGAGGRFAGDDGSGERRGRRIWECRSLLCAWSAACDLARFACDKGPRTHFVCRRARLAMRAAKACGHGSLLFPPLRCAHRESPWAGQAKIAADVSIRAIFASVWEPVGAGDRFLERLWGAGFAPLLGRFRCWARRDCPHALYPGVFDGGNVSRSVSRRIRRGGLAHAPYPSAFSAAVCLTRRIPALPARWRAGRRWPRPGRGR